MSGKSSFRRLLSFGQPFAPEAVDLFARMSTPPTPARKVAINTAISSLKANGVWGKLEVLQVYAAADEQAASLNWCNTSYTASTVSAPTFTADYGYSTNGTSNYVSTGFAPSLSSFSGTNDASMGMWLPKARQTPTAYVTVSPNQSLLWRTSDTSFYGGLNHTNAAADQLTGLLELHHLIGVSRTGASETKIYQSNTASAVITRASTARSAGVVFLGARNLNNGTAGLFGACDYSMFWHGKGLSDADVAAIQAAFVPYMKTIGNYLYGLDCWGDSRTLGATQTPFPTQVRTSSSSKRIARNGGVSGDTSSQILTRMTAATAYYDFVQVIWAGYNDRNSVSTVQSNIQSMVELANARNGGKYLVLTIPPPRDAAFYAGTTDGDNIRTINAWIKNTYGSKAVDVSATLTSGDPNGVTLAAYVINTVTDFIHFNTAGLGLVATDVETACVSNGW